MAVQLVIVLFYFIMIVETQVDYFQYQLQPVDYCPQGYQTDASSAFIGCYLMISRETSSDLAASYCDSSGGYLASVSNIEEQSFIDAITGSVPTWIGGIVNADGSGFRWNNGKPVTFTNFAAGEPIRNHGSCIVTSNTGWKSAPCLSWAPVLCRTDKYIFQRKHSK